MNILSFPRITNLNPSFFKNNIKQNTLNFKGQIEADTFERTSETPELKRGQILDEKGKIFTRNNTRMFRDDLNWEDFGQYLKDKFKDFNKVNTYLYACSSGKEPYTLSILLQHIFKEEAQKFFPINAKDIDENLIQKNIHNQNNERILETSYYPAKLALHLDDKQTKEYITLDEHKIENLTEKTINPVEFSCANILDDIENIDSENPSIIMCRNMWPYVNSSEYEDFAVKLYDKLAKGSVIVIGSYDYKGEAGKKDSKTFPASLLKAGFEAVDKRKNKFTKGGALIFEKN